MPSFSRLVKRNEFISLFDSRQNDNMNMLNLFLVFSKINVIEYKLDS